MALNVLVGGFPHSIVYGEDKRLPYELLCSKPRPVYSEEEKSQNVFNNVKQCLQKANKDMVGPSIKLQRRMTFMKVSWLLFWFREIRVPYQTQWEAYGTIPGS